MRPREQGVNGDILGGLQQNSFGETPMQTTRRLLLLLFLAVSFAPSLPLLAQQVIATVPVGAKPGGVAVNPVTNKIYVANGLCNDNDTCGPGTVTVVDGASDNIATVNVGIGPGFVAANSATNKIYVTNGCGADPNCVSPGTVTVIDGVTDTTITTLTAGLYPGFIAVNRVTNKIYVVNNCGNDPNCGSAGTVTVIDGATNTINATITVGGNPFGVDVNPVTNKIYVVNNCGNDPNCASTGTVTVIDGATNNTTSVNVGSAPFFEAVDSVTNKIYVANACGNDVNCQSHGTVTVIDGATNNTTTVDVGAFRPFGVALNAVTDKIYVVNVCGNDPACASAGTVTVIDGATNNTTPVNVESFPYFAAVDSVTNKVYVVNAFCNKLKKHVGLDCSSGPGAVTAIDGATNNIVPVTVGDGPFFLGVNATTNRIYAPNVGDATVSVIAGASSAPQQFVPVTPCRLLDTRPEKGGSGPIPGGTSLAFNLPQLAQSASPPCASLASAAAYSLNVSVVPEGPLGYLTIWPTGEDQPVVATLNSLDGRIKADAAIVPAGYQGDISIYSTQTTNVILDINGYFAPVSGSTLAFYPMTPCRIADTRKSNFPPGLGTPFLSAKTPRDFPVLSSTCNIPNTAQAYSLNLSAVPYPGLGHPLGYLEVWPKGQMPANPVSTLNNLTGTVVANAAIVPTGTGGDITVFPSNNTDLVIDINGYFAPAGPGGLSLYPAAPCRVIDTRKVGGGQPFSGSLSPPVDVVDSTCAPPSTAQAYVFNATVVPYGALGYLTLWQNDPEHQPVVSTLNALDSAITNNMAIVPTADGKIDAYASGTTQLILDISSYFAP
jgi:YVTN family beta-propeller protein